LTQIDVSRSITAVLAVVMAVRCAVPPVTQPPQLKPTIIVRMMQATTSQKTIVFVGCASFHLFPRLTFASFKPFDWAIVHTPSCVARNIIENFTLSIL
jgi:hypothetical protein